MKLTSTQRSQAWRARQHNQQRAISLFIPVIMHEKLLLLCRRDGASMRDAIIRLIANAR
jgi:hypothetical protein